MYQGMCSVLVTVICYEFNEMWLNATHGNGNVHRIHVVVVTIVVTVVRSLDLCC